MTTETLKQTMTGEEMIALSKKHTLFEWAAQSKVDPIPVARAKGIYFWTPEGKRFIDFNSQLMCVNIGHGDERVIRAIQEQAAVLAYANPFMATEPRARLGARLAEITPGDIDVFFFTNGGAEANENAIKLARMTTGRHKILARYRSYHGATAGSITLTGDPRRWAAEPGMPGVVHVLDPYHGIARGWESAEESLAMLDEVIQLEGPQTIAAFILETVTGTNGVLVPPDGYMQGVRELCTKHGILMICDEVMAGFGRTGEWFAVDHWNVVPARTIGAIMKELMDGLARRHPSVGAARSIGLFGLVELVRDRARKVPLAPFNGTSDEMAALGRFFREEGLYTFVRWNTFFTNPPLFITDAQLRDAFAIIDRALEVTDRAVR